MALPAKAKTWIIDPCNRIAFVSLLTTMQAYLYEATAFLLANGYTCKFSASAGVGPASAADTTNRWANAVAVMPRATAAAASQAWIVLTDGSAGQILIAFQGASDDIARISYSPTGAFVPAATPSHQPTATDELVMLTALSLIDATASADRVWSGWVTSDAKMCRFGVARSGAWVGRFWGVELFTVTGVNVPASAPVPVIAWGMAATNSSIPPGAVAAGNQAHCRTLVSSVAFSAVVGGGNESALGISGLANYSGFTPELQGGAPLIFALSLWTLTVGTRGKLGNRIDWWFALDNQIPGQTTVGKDFIHMNHQLAASNSGWLWPWDSVTTPTMS